MRYFGGKSKLRKVIIPILNHYAKQKNIYIEPFVGGGSIFFEVAHKNKIAGDKCLDLILMYNAIKNGWNPPNTITKELYNKLKKEKSSALRGFAAFSCSFGGKWFGGYAKGRDSFGFERNYCYEAKIALRRKFNKTINQSIDFIYGDYYKLLQNIENALIYCDPPYKDTCKHFGIVGGFSNDRFWKIMREVSLLEKNNMVIISEIAAPKDFKILTSDEKKYGMSDIFGNRYSRLEHLFKFEGNSKEGA